MEYLEYLENCMKHLDTQKLIDISQYMFNEDMCSDKYVNIDLSGIKEVFKISDNDNAFDIVRKVFLANENNRIRDSYNLFSESVAIYVLDEDNFDFSNKALMACNIAANIECCTDDEIKNINDQFNLSLKPSEEFKK